MTVVLADNPGPMALDGARAHLAAVMDSVLADNPGTMTLDRARAHLETT